MYCTHRSSQHRFFSDSTLAAYLVAVDPSIAESNMGCDQFDYGIGYVPVRLQKESADLPRPHNPNMTHEVITSLDPDNFNFSPHLRRLFVHRLAKSLVRELRAQNVVVHALVSPHPQHLRVRPKSAGIKHCPFEVMVEDLAREADDLQVGAQEDVVRRNCLAFFGCHAQDGRNLRLNAGGTIRGKLMKRCSRAELVGCDVFGVVDLGEVVGYPRQEVILTLFWLDGCVPERVVETFRA